MKINWVLTQRKNKNNNRLSNQYPLKQRLLHQDKMEQAIILKNKMQRRIEKRMINKMKMDY